MEPQVFQKTLQVERAAESKGIAVANRGFTYKTLAGGWDMKKPSKGNRGLLGRPRIVGKCPRVQFTRRSRSLHTCWTLMRPAV